MAEAQTAMTTAPPINPDSSQADFEGTAVALSVTDGEDERLARWVEPRAIPPDPPTDPTPEERRRMQAATREVARRPPPPEIRVGYGVDCAPTYGLSSTDTAGWLAQAQLALGTCSPAFVEVELLGS